MVEPLLVTRSDARVRRRARWARLLVASAVLCAVSVASAGELRIATRMLPCRDDTSIADEIQRRVGLSMAQQPDLKLLLQGSPSDRLTIRLEGARGSLERSVPFGPGDCDALAPAAMLLLRDWLQRDWTPLPDLAAGAPSPQPATERAIARKADHQSATLGHALSLAALAGAFVSPGGLHLGPTASLRTSVAASSRVALGAAAGYQGRIEQRIAPGTVSVAVFRLDAIVSAVLARGEAHRLDVVTGPSLCVLDIDSSGYARSLSARRVELAWIGALDYRLRLSERVSWLSSLQADARSRSDVVRVVGAAAMAVPPVRISLSSGVAWDLL